MFEATGSCRIKGLERGIENCGRVLLYGFTSDKPSRDWLTASSDAKTVPNGNR
jgi:hypothetical protein